MYDRHMETPNTPTELLALQEPQEESFASVVEDAINEFEPEPKEALSVVNRILRSLKAMTYDMIDESEDYLKQQWQEDYEKLTKALDLLKAVDL